MGKSLFVFFVELMRVNSFLYHSGSRVKCLLLSPDVPATLTEFHVSLDYRRDPRTLKGGSYRVVRCDGPGSEVVGSHSTCLTEGKRGSGQWKDLRVRFQTLVKRLVRLTTE